MRIPRISGSGQVAMEPDWRTIQKWSGHRESEETNTSADLTSLRCHLSGGTEYPDVLDTIYMYRAFCAARSTECVYSTMLYSHAELAIYSRLVTVQNTLPSPCLSDTTSQVEPVSPLDGGSCGDLCPTLPGSRLAKGPIIIRIIWGIWGLLQEIPAPVRSFTWP